VSSGIKIGQSQAESYVIKANPKFFAVPSSGSSIVVLGSQVKGNVENSPVLVKEDDPINEFNFDPFNFHSIAAAHNSGKISIWTIPEDGLTSDITSPTRQFSFSDKRLMGLDYHPLAQGVLIGFDAAKTIKIFDVEASSEKFKVDGGFKGLLSNFTWNADGSLCAVSAKDKILRVIDPRQNTVASEGPDHQGSKAGRVDWLLKKKFDLLCGIFKIFPKKHQFVRSTCNWKRTSFWNE